MRRTWDCASCRATKRNEKLNCAWSEIVGLDELGCRTRGEVPHATEQVPGREPAMLRGWKSDNVVRTLFVIHSGPRDKRTISYPLAHRSDLSDAPRWSCPKTDVGHYEQAWVARFGEYQDGFAPAASEWSPMFRAVMRALKGERAACLESEYAGAP